MMLRNWSTKRKSKLEKQKWSYFNSHKRLEMSGRQINFSFKDWRFISRSILAAWSSVPETSARCFNVYPDVFNSHLLLCSLEVRHNVYEAHGPVQQAVVYSWICVHPERGANIKNKKLIDRKPWNVLFSYAAAMGLLGINSNLAFENKFNPAYFLLDLLCARLPSSGQGSDIKPK